MITVRAAAPAEYERVGALTITAYQTLPVDHLWGGYGDQILDTAGRSAHGDILVAITGDGSVVGAVTYVADARSPWSEGTEPGEAQFRLLAVDADARHHGAGNALVRACTERATADDRSILIHTTPWMEAAQRMYARLGFVRRPDRDLPYEVWNADPRSDLPPEWVGQPFLAYSWSNSA